jgi:hypothetical protein
LLGEFISVLPSGVEETKPLSQLSLYPNPASEGDIKINFGIQTAGKCRIEIRKISGELVKTLIEENCQTGDYAVEFNGEMLSQGWYICVVYINGEVANAIKFGKI